MPTKTHQATNGSSAAALHCCHFQADRAPFINASYTMNKSRAIFFSLPKKFHVRLKIAIPGPAIFAADASDASSRQGKDIYEVQEFRMGPKPRPRPKPRPNFSIEDPKPLKESSNNLWGLKRNWARCFGVIPEPGIFFFGHVTDKSNHPPHIGRTLFSFSAYSRVTNFFFFQ